MNTRINLPNYAIGDRIERELAHLVELKRQTVKQIESVIEAHRVHGQTHVLEPLADSLNVEQSQLWGYELALTKRREKLAAHRAKGGR